MTKEQETLIALGLPVLFCFDTWELPWITECRYRASGEPNWMYENILDLRTGFVQYKQWGTDNPYSELKWANHNIDSTKYNHYFHEYINDIYG